MSQSVVKIVQSMEEERPNLVTYYHPSDWFQTEEGYEAFQKNAFVCSGKEGHTTEQWFVPDLWAPERGSTPIEAWDYYMCSGSFGAFSPRAIEVLMPYLAERFEPLPARLEGHPYYCLRCTRRIDCLDKDRSKIVYFEEPDDVMEIEKYAFRKGQLTDPMIFAIPQLFLEVFCTESIPKITARAGLRGFDFQIVDGGS